MEIDTEYFEYIIAQNLLTDNRYIAAVAPVIQGKYFKNKDIGRISTVIKAFYQKRGSAPTSQEIRQYLVSDALRKAGENVTHRLSVLGLTASPFNQDELYTNTETWLKEKAVYHTMMDTIEQSADGMDTSKLLKQFEAACAINLNPNIGLDYFKDIDRHVEDLKAEDVYIPTGFSWLDQKLGGGLVESGRAMYIFAGQTNVGKSIALGNIAVNIAKQGRTVVLISLEMSELMYAKRISSNLTQLPIAGLKDSADSLRERVINFRESHSKSRLIIKEFPPSTVTPHQLGSYLRSLTDKGIKIDCIVLDYINLLAASYGTSSYERVKSISEQTRALTYDFKAPLVSATQLNREGYSESDPSLETVGESYGLGATADAMMSLWQDEGDADLGYLRMGLMKSRFGPNFGTCNLAIDYSTLSLSDSDMINSTEETAGTLAVFSEISVD